MAKLNPNKVQWPILFEFADGRRVSAVHYGTKPVRYCIGSGELGRDGAVWMTPEEVHKLPGATGPQYEARVMRDGSIKTRKCAGVDP